MRFQSICWTGICCLFLIACGQKAPQAKVETPSVPDETETAAVPSFDTPAAILVEYTTEEFQAMLDQMEEGAEEVASDVGYYKMTASDHFKARNIPVERVDALQFQLKGNSYTIDIDRKKFQEDFMDLILFDPTRGPIFTNTVDFERLYGDYFGPGPEAPQH